MSINAGKHSLTLSPNGGRCAFLAHSVVYTVSPKNCAKLFCQNVIKFSPTLIIFDTWIARRIGSCEVYLFSVIERNWQ